jgi:hypothetical protein
MRRMGLWSCVGMLVACAQVPAATLVKFDGAVSSGGLMTGTPSIIAPYVTQSSFFPFAATYGTDVVYESPNAYTNITDSRVGGALSTALVLDVEPGYVMTITGFRVDVGANKTDADAITAMGIYWDVNDFDINAPLGIGFAIDTIADGVPVQSTLDVPIDNVRLGSVRFNIYFAGNVPRTIFDDLEVLGTVSLVPEPVLPGALALGGMIVRRRRA